MAILIPLLACAGRANAGHGAADTLAVCAAVAEPAARLACYDALAARMTKPPAISRSPAAAPWTLSPLPSPSPIGTIQASGAGRESRSPGLRLEAALGYGHGLYSGTVDFDIDDRPAVLTSDAATGGAGHLLTAGLWLDDWLADGWSLGLEYLRLRQHADLGIRLPRGVDILSDPVNGKVSLDLTGNLWMLDLARIMGDGGRWHYMLGGGLGLALLDLRFEAAVRTALLEGGSIGDSDRSPILAPAGHIFFGTQADLGERFYLTAKTHLIGGTARPVGVPHEFYDLVVTLGGGIRF